MTDKKYFSVRTGKHPYNNRINLQRLIKIFQLLYKDLTCRQFFNEAFGTHCDEYGYPVRSDPGYLWDIETVIFVNLRKENLWPIEEMCDSYSEDDLFDVIEFLFDHVSKPTKQCYTGNPFDKEAGQKIFRDEINKIIVDYEDGYELSEEGEIRRLPDIGLETLVEAKLPEYDPENVENKVEEAKKKYFSRHSSLEDRKDAIRSLADVLEFIRADLKKVITKKDDGTLFTIANEFGIRHHNDNQKTEYERSIWYSWMFYYYLATIHAGLRLIEKNKKDKGA